MSTMPTLFVSHGSPTFALEPGQIGETYSRLGQTLPRPRAILVLSAHWMTRGLRVTTHPQPETIHDFGGFPQPLYELRYPAPGAPQIAQSVVDLLNEQGLATLADPSRGFDHGVWVPLLHLYPNADIPVIALSLPAFYSTRETWMLGRACAALRDQGILIIGSGSITHNLYERSMGPAEPYVTEFTDWTDDQIKHGNIEALLDYRRLSQAGVRAHPTEEHLLPLYFAIGAAGEEWSHARRLTGQITHGVLSMDAWLFAETSGAAQED
ncbi:hypothetical protein ADIMK_1114 [Marinobacterium lacunae]|uniref:Extradiol ring-cleavage dioxygenase class III enzyme subunit B domain-containing protein n=1 Tax=Marinobacterium lacunae TaxID=1232683 RepID=A0A081G1K6_9GAMM|nr:class III extradiol ring-cleavage dioxygenase [Marinobacterium lacunae]KEA64661.1 hypothetical protein ADIMK_1114 [Marinobacterium lacunae]